MNYKISFIVILSSAIVSCTQSIDSGKIERKDGLYTDKGTGELLDGKYESVEPIGGTYSGNHESTFEYDEGIPVGEWTYTFNGDPIHSGKYLVENELKSKINSLTNSKITDLNFWEEGGYWMLDIELLFPNKKDSVIIKTVVDITNDAILTKYNYKSIDVFAVNDSVKEKIYWEKLK